MEVLQSNGANMQLILEVGKNKLPGLSELDNLFDALKKSKTTSKDETIRKKIEKCMENIFGTPFFIDLHYLGTFANNCAVIPIIKRGGKIEKTEDLVKLGNVKKVYIILGNEMIKESTPRELTAIFLHEIGHIVNHISGSLSIISDLSYKLSYVFNSLNHIPLLNILILPLYIVSSRTLYFTQHVGEYNADKFAAEYGYGDELISVIHKWNLEYKKYESEKTFWTYLSQLKAFILGQSHPEDTDRIKKLAEEIKKNYSNKYKSKKLEKILNEYYS